MAVGAGFVIASLIALAVVGGGSKKKGGAKAPATTDATIMWADDGSYVIGDQWWTKVATPRVQEIVGFLEQQGANYVDPYAVAYSILEGQTGPFQRPTTAYPVPPPAGQAGEWGDVWQTEIPGRPDYYDGPDTVLFLTQHIADHVVFALDQYTKGYPLVLTGSFDACPEGFVYDEQMQQCIPTTPGGGMPSAACPEGMVYNVRTQTCVPAGGN